MIDQKDATEVSVGGRNIYRPEIDSALDLLSALGYEIWLHKHLLVRDKNSWIWVKK